jgi:hypothetical protein
MWISSGMVDARRTDSMDRLSMAATQEIAKLREY